MKEFDNTWCGVIGETFAIDQRVKEVVLFGPECEYIIPGNADQWFTPMYVVDIEFCKSSLKLKAPELASEGIENACAREMNSSNNVSMVRLPDIIHRTWCLRKKLASALNQHLTIRALLRVDVSIASLLLLFFGM